MLLWFWLTNEIMWHNWKARNENIFKGAKRELIEFKIKLTFLNVAMQVSVQIEISSVKFLRLIREGTVTSNREEVRCGKANQANSEEAEIFRKAMDELQREVNEVANQDREPDPQWGEAPVDPIQTPLEQASPLEDKQAEEFVEGVYLACMYRMGKRICS